MTQTNGKQPPKSKRLRYRALGRAARLIGHYKLLTTLAVVFLLIGIAAQLMVPVMVQEMIGVMSAEAAVETAAPATSAAATADAQASQTGALTEKEAIVRLIELIAIVLVLATIYGAASFIQSFDGEKLSQELAFDLRNHLFKKIENLSFSYHDNHSTGQLMIRATDDVEKVRQFLGQGLLMIVQALVLFVGAMTMMLITDWRLTLIVLPILPIAVVLFMVFGAVTQPMFMKIQITLSQLNALLEENLTGIKVIKAFVREKDEYKIFEQTATQLMKQEIGVARVFSFLFPIIFLVANLGQTALLYFGGAQILQGTLTLGEWQKFSLYLVFLFFPIGQLGFIISQLNQASASATRIYTVLDTENIVIDKPDAIPAPPLKGHVQFADVTFRYYDSSEPVLVDINVKAEPGQMVAILGTTGSGKSTLINLIPRFYDVEKGQVLVDEINVRDLKIDSLRTQIGIVFQQSNLFAGTIRDNIALGRPDATEEEIKAAAREADADNFIMSFAKGYDTPVSEGGGSMSGGQKQRIAIARALLLDPRILILDDATASVDLAEERVYGYIRNLKRKD